MGEIHRARLMDSGEVVTVESPNPTDAAIRFKELSDKIWALNPERKPRWASFGIDSQMSPEEAVGALNNVLETISAELPILGTGKDITLSGPRGDKVTVGAEMLASPERAFLDTYNWDARNTAIAYGPVVNGRSDVAQYIDGHTDYYRELGVRFSLGSSATTDTVTVSYSFQRIETKQDQPTSLTQSVHVMAFAETGYEGNHLLHAQMSDEQELRLLDVFTGIGGLALNTV